MKKKIFAFLTFAGLVLSAACDRTTTGIPTSTLGFPVFASPTYTFTVTLTITRTPLSTPTPVLTVTCPFSLVTQWGAPGAGNGQFKAAADVTVDAAGNVYVLDMGNKRVQKFTSAGTYLSQWNANGSFLVPTNIAFQSVLSRIYVLDTTTTNPFTGVIKVFDINGAIYPGWLVPQNSYGLAIDNQGNVYVGAQNKAIKYDQNGANPQYYYNNGLNGSSFNGIQALAVDSNGSLFVGTSSFVQKFDSGRKFIIQWGSPGGGQGQFNGIAFMCTDSQGNVYVVDNLVNGNVYTGRIQKFDTDGNFICYYQTPGVQLQGLQLSAAGNLYVVDATNQQIRKF